LTWEQTNKVTALKRAIKQIKLEGIK